METVGGNLTLGSGAELSEAELEMLDGITAGTVAASKAVVVDANKDIASFRNVTLTGELDAATGDFSGDVDVDGTLEADAITVNGTALATVIAGTSVTTATNANHISVADNESTNEENLIPFIEDASATGNVGLESDGDFAYNPSTGTVSATVFKGNIDAVDGDFDGTLEADAMTLNGTAITATATLDTGISNNNVPKFTSGVADDDFLRVNGTAIEGRSASEVLSDIGASAVAGSSSIVTTGALDSGSITSGFGNINNGTSTLTTGNTDINGTVAISGDTTLEDGADLITASAGTSNVRIGVNAGNSITSGGNYNVVVGDEAGTAITTGDSNVAVGYNAGAAINTGEKNTLIGGRAGDALTTGSSNVALGRASLSADTLGSCSIAIGRNALINQNFTSATDSFNTVVGDRAGSAITTGIQNTLIGSLAGDALTDADYNTALGYLALTADTKGNRSTALGYGALKLQNFTSVTNTDNTAVGYDAGREVTTATKQTFLGNFSGKTQSTGNNNTYIGYDAGSLMTTGSDNTIIGCYNGNQGGLDIRTLSNRIVLSDGDGNPRGIFDGDGTFLVGETSASDVTNGTGSYIAQNGQIYGSSSSSHFLNKQADGDVLVFRQGGTTEGSVSISGTTTSYNGGHLSRWSQLTDNTRDNTLVKGTVMTNLDQMAEWTTDGVTEDNEQLNCMAVSSVEGDANVAGVFVNWDNDDKVYTNDMNVAMTGDMVIRIAKGVTVARGELLMSAGDGTAKPQGDDIVKSKTIAKVTSTNKSHTYDDGTYLVPCVLMAC